MFTDIPLAFVAGILLPVNASIEQAARPQVFVELIVKACPSADQSAQANKPSAVQGITPNRSIREKTTSMNTP